LKAHHLAVDFPDSSSVEIPSDFKQFADGSNVRFFAMLTGYNPGTIFEAGHAKPSACLKMNHIHMLQYVPSEKFSQASDYLEYLRRRRFSALDGLRAIAIIAVLWHHGANSHMPVLRLGFLGVDLFFVISGFLIVTLLLREKQETGGISLSAFYARRALRIFPIYYGLLGALALAYFLFKPEDPDATLLFSLLPIYLFYLSNWSLVQATNLEITWSLAAEEQFYLVWPLIEKLKSVKTIWALLAIAIGINQLINFGWLDPLFNRLYGMENGVGLNILDATFTPILLGVALAHLLNQPRGYALMRRLVGGPAMSWIVLAFLVAVMAAAPSDISGWPRLIIQLLMMLWIAALTIREDSALHPLLDSRPFVFVGGISYGMYLYHLWVFHVVSAVLRKAGIAFPGDLFIVGTALTIVVAYLSFVLVERWFLKQKGRFSPRPAPMPGGTRAAVTG
jgi:peptidoglycan/LPS O-acetylase OafA/YrhL